MTGAHEMPRLEDLAAFTDQFERDHPEPEPMAPMLVPESVVDALPRAPLTGSDLLFSLSSVKVIRGGALFPGKVALIAGQARSATVSRLEIHLEDSAPGGASPGV